MYRMVTAYYHLPGLFEFYELYRVFLPLYREHRDWFYDWCEIGSIYGAPADCIWGGGRAGHDGIALSFCESEELPYLKDIQKLIGKSIPVIKEHPFVTADGLKAQEIKTEEIKAKTKENKIYRGSRTNGDFWRRKKQTSQNNTPKGVGR